MERQSTSKLFRALIAVVAFFVLCTSAILFASCGTDPKECGHDNLTDGKLVSVTKETCGQAGTLTYECPECGAEVTVTGTLATGAHTFGANGACSVCGLVKEEDGLTLEDVKNDLTAALTALQNSISGKFTEVSAAIEAAKQNTDSKNAALVEQLTGLQTTLTTKLNGLVQEFVNALQDEDFTIPALNQQLTELKTKMADVEADLKTVQDKLAALEEGFGDLNFDFDLGDIQLADDEEGKTGSTLGEVISSLYKQVNALYTDYLSKTGDKTANDLYALFVGGEDAEAHVHNWVLKLKAGTELSCTAENTYVWTCSFCSETKGSEVTVNPTGHVTEFKSGLEPANAAHYYAATCISGARVEGHCAVCGEWTGEWTEIGQPTYQHNYVLENGKGADGTVTGTEGHCTSVHKDLVYHCTTCGGAYVVKGSEDKGTEHHNYYFVADETTGAKRAMTDQEKIDVWNDNHNTDEQISSLTGLTVKQEQELNELLEDNLNIVYWSDPNCVDPSLIVVECMECGVRYAYTFGEPNGHTFTIKSKKVNATCTMDGCEPYFYCEHCGYYFMFDEGADFLDNASWPTTSFKEGDTLTGVSETLKTQLSTYLARYRYTRKYLETLPDGSGKTEVLNAKGLTGTALTAMEQKAYDVATAKSPAKGHSYVVVYTNTFSCVTERTYILVCTECFHDKTGNGFAKLVEGASGAATTTYFKVEDAKAGTYILKDLNDDNTDQANIDAAIKAVTDLVTPDDRANTKPDDLCDLTKEYNEVFKKDQDQYETAQIDQLKWLIKHGYLVRDAGDDEVWGSLTPAHLDGKASPTDVTDAELTAILNKLGNGDFDLATLYCNKNVVYSTVPAAATGTATKPAPAFVNPVTGHSFNDYVETVIGSCVTYERHVYFCEKCGDGANTLNPEPTDGTGTDKEPGNHDHHYVTGHGPFNVTGQLDTVLAKFDTPEERTNKTDLRKSWEKVFDPESSDNDGNAMLVWLVKYGYLNDYRTDLKTDWSKVDPLDPETYYDYFDELGIIQQRLAAARPELFKDSDASKLSVLFTEKNVLEEFTVKKHWGDMVSTNDTDVVLGHKFDVVKLLNAEVCDEPGYYVYVCSVCGNTATWDTNGGYNADKVTPETGKLGDLTFFNGSNIVDTKLKQLPEASYKPLTDTALFEMAVPTQRRGATYNGTYGSKIETDDLKAEWSNLVGTSDSQAVKEDKQLNWLLNKGYLNNLIDTYLMDGLEASDPTHGISTADYAAARAALYDAQGALLSDVKAEVLEMAKELASDHGYSDYNAFYIQSGDLYNNTVTLTGQAANKTNDHIATEIPLAGHYYAKEGGQLLLSDDPQCGGYALGKDGKVTDELTGAASKVLTQFYKEHKIVCWVDDLDGNSKNGNQSGWKVIGTFVDGDLDPDFKAQADKYGIIAACRRENCPQHSPSYTGTYPSGSHQAVADDWEDKLGTPFTAGYVAAQEHEMSYQKYKADKDGYPTSEIETRPDANGGDPIHVFYNKKTLGDYLPAGKVLTTEEVETGVTTVATAAEKKAAQEAMDADLLNLFTLQKIWNALFIPADWQAENAKAYPVLDKVANVSLTGTIDWAKLEAAFNSYNEGVGPTYLWTDKHTSAWRPLSDEIVNGYNAASCWVSLRCEWYGETYKTSIYTQDGVTLSDKIENSYTCTYKNPDNRHDLPKYGDFGFDTHVANCKHKDLCDTCGKPYGTDGQHNLINVSELTGNNQAAWLEVLKHKDAISWLKDIVNVDKDGDGQELEDWNDWEFIEGTCYTGDENPELGEQDHIVYFCTGELEVIYNEIVAGESTWADVVGVGKDVDLRTSTKATDITWTAAMEVAEKAGTSATVNYYVQAVHPEHKFVRMYFYLTAEGKIDLNNPIPADIWNDGWTSVKCMQGYAVADVCVNVRRDGKTVCGHVYNSSVDNDHTYNCWEENPSFNNKLPESATNVKYLETEIACHNVEEHKSAGHFVAPVLNYWTYEYEPKSAEKNAVLSQVCTICGEAAHGEYGNLTDGRGDREQYHLASGKQITDWNAHLDNIKESDVTKYAQLIRAEDITKLTEVPAGAPNTHLFNQNEVNVFQGENNTVKATSNKNPNYDASKPETGPEYYDTYLNIDGDVTILVGTDGEEGSKGKLTFDKDSADTHVKDVYLSIGSGNIAFVGEGADVSTVDFSKLKGVDLGGVANVTFEDITVDLGANALNNWQQSGSTLTFRNAKVTTSGTPLAMLSTDNNEKVKVVIEDSTFISTAANDVGLGSWLKNAEIIATGSTFVGNAAGAWIRGGKATFTDCTFATKAGTKGPGIGSGSNLPNTTSAALVVGNTNYSVPNNNYGNAEVVLNNCKFGTFSNTYTDNDALSPCTDTDPSIVVFSSQDAGKTNYTKLTLDAITFINTVKIDKSAAGTEGTNFDVKIPPVEKAALGKNETEQKENAVKLVESLAAKGGEVSLPAGLSFNLTNELTIATGVKVTLDIGDGSTVTLDGGLSVQGDLTIEGQGILDVKKHNDNNTAIVVDQAGSSLTLNGTELTVTATNTPYAIFAENGAEVHVNNSLVYSSVGMALATNNTKNAGKFVLVNSAFVSDVKTRDAEADGGIYALLINNDQSSIYAGGCTFYGSTGAAFIRSTSEAVFAGCTFISGGAKVDSAQTWAGGTEVAQAAVGAIVVGSGSDYGPVNAQFIDGDVYFANTPAADKTQGKPQGTTVDGYKFDAEKNTMVKTGSKADGWTYSETTAAAIALELKDNTKLFTITAYSTNKATVNFSDEDTAKRYLGNDLALKKGENLFLEGGATLEQIDVTYTYEETVEGQEDPVEKKMTIQPVVETTKESVTSDLKDALANGGKVVFPKEVEQDGITVSEKLTVKDGATIELNGNTLKPSASIDVKNGEEGKTGELTISGGNVEASVNVQENGGLTLDGVEMTGMVILGYETTAPEKSGAHVTIKNSLVDGGTKTPLYVNGDVDGATVTLENSQFMGSAGLGLWIAGETHVEATNCVFYGSVAAVEVCSGSATFTGCTFVTTGEDHWTDNGGTELTWFGYGSCGFPTATRANLVINSKGGGYDGPVNVEVSGPTTFLVAKIAEAGGKVDDVFVKDRNSVLGDKTQQLSMGTKADGTARTWYYEADNEHEVEKISVAVVCADYASQSTALVTLKLVNTSVGFQLDKNVLLYDNGGTASSKTAAAQNKSCSFDIAQKVVGITGATFVTRGNA